MKTYHLINTKLNGLSKRVFFIVFIILSFHLTPKAQERKLVYDVIRKGNVIGTINFVEQIKDKKRFLLFQSDVKTKYIFSYADYCEEAATYEDGVMVYSSFYQKQNGSDKAYKKTIASGNNYTLTDDGTSKMLRCNPIRYNMLLLYCLIPENVTQVYSDKYQRMLDLKKIDEYQYRLSLPDGNYNYYTYSNSICSKVVVERTFFTINFVLRNKQ